MQFTDCFGGTIYLSADALEHIKTAHSEVSIAEIARALCQNIIRYISFTM